MANARSAVPTAENLSQLTMWSKIVFGARCLRRLEPLMSNSGDVSPELVSTTTRAIEQCEASALRGSVSSDMSAILQLSLSSLQQSNNIASLAISRAAANLALAVDSEVLSRLTEVVTIAENMHFEGSKEPALDHWSFVQSLWWDYDLLRSIAEKDNWNDDSPVDPDLLGPLWPAGIPSWWPEDSLSDFEAPPVIAFQFTTPAGVDPERLSDQLAEFFTNCNQLHLAFGGTGLSFHQPPASFEDSGTPVTSGGGGEDDFSPNGSRGAP